MTLRMSMVGLPGGTRFELTHFQGLERQPGEAKYSDPGAGSLVLYVRDIDALTAAAKKANAPIVTTGGNPVEIATRTGKARSIVFRDPDGFFLQLVQEAPAAGAPETNVHRVSLAYTMEDAAATRTHSPNSFAKSSKPDTRRCAHCSAPTVARAGTASDPGGSGIIRAAGGAGRPATWRGSW